MSITVSPVLTVDGTTVPASLAAGGQLVGVDAVRLTYGRQAVLDQSTPATLSLAVLDRAAGAPFARRTDLIGRPVTLGWAGSDGSSGTSFRGRLTDVDVAPRAGAIAGGGFLSRLAASSMEVDLASVVIPEGTILPAESFTARAARLLAYAPAGLIAGVVLPDRLHLGLADPFVPGTDPADATAAQVDAGGKDLLALFRQLFTSLSPLPMVYDPASQQLTFAGRRRFSYSQIGWTASAQLVQSPDQGGQWVAASTGGLHLDGGRLAYSGSLSQRPEQHITRVEVTFLDSANAWAQTVAVSSTSWTPDEPTSGRRTLSIDSLQSTAAGAAQLAALYADVVNREGASRVLAPLTFSTEREPLHDAGHAQLLLAGAERGQTLFIGRSWLTQLARRPLVGILGATTTYAAGEWSVNFTPAPVIIDPVNGSWGPITANACAPGAVKLKDVHESVTVGDLAFIDVGAGFTTATGFPYKGNPNP